MQDIKDLHPDLSDGSIFSEDIVHLFCGDLVWQISYIQDSVDFRRKPNLKILELSPEKRDHGIVQFELFHTPKISATDKVGI